MNTTTLGTRLIGIATLIVVAVGLKMTRDATLPIVAGGLIAMMVHPVREYAARFLPRALALLATVLLVVAITVTIFGALGWSATRISERLIERRERLEEVHQQASSAAARVGLQLPDFPSSVGGGGDTAAAPGAARGTGTGSGANAGSQGGGMARRVGGAIFSGFSALGLTIGFMALALAETRSTARRIHQRLAPERANQLMMIAGEVAHTLRRYIGVKSLTSAITGLSTLLITLAFGLDFVLTWGLIAFLFEYVPTIGSVLAVVPPALYALVQFDGLARPLALTGALTVMQLFLGNYVDPKIEGRMLSLSPFVVLASIVVWAWIWGAPGALLGVPLTIVITTVAQHFDRSRWIWALLTEPDDDGDERGKRAVPRSS